MVSYCLKLHNAHKPQTVNFDVMPYSVQMTCVEHAHTSWLGCCWFQVSSKSMEERVLRLTVYDVDRHKKHQVIGHALYPLKAHAHDDNERVVIWRDLEREVSEVSKIWVRFYGLEIKF